MSQDVWENDEEAIDAVYQALKEVNSSGSLINWDVQRPICMSGKCDWDDCPMCDALQAMQDVLNRRTNE